MRGDHHRTVILASVAVALVALAAASTTIASSTPASSTADWPLQYVGQWGSTGSANGQFDGPYGAEIGPSGRIYVADRVNDRVQYFTLDGAFLGAFGTSGTAGSEFDWPADVALDHAGNVFAVEWVNHRVQKFDRDGNFVLMWGAGVKTGADVHEICMSSCLPGLDSNVAGGFDAPQGVAVNPSGLVYVADTWNSRIQIFDADGVHLETESNAVVGDLSRPAGIDIDDSGYVYVTDWQYYRVVKYAPAGAFLRTWGYGVQDGSAVFQICTSGCLPGIFGSGDGQFGAIYDLTADSNRGVVHVAGGQFDRIQVFTPDGAFLGKWGSLGSGNGEMDNPVSIDIDEAGFIYVVDSANDRVEKFKDLLDFIIAGRGSAVPSQVTGPRAGVR